MDDIRVTVATEQEIRACAAMLPQARVRTAEFLIARAGREPVGAAAIHWRNWTRPAGFPIAIEVAPDARGRGVARRLLAAAKELALYDTDGFWPFDPVVEGGPEASFMLRVGCRVHVRQFFYRARIDSLLSHLTPLLGRLQRRAGSTHSLEIAPLAEPWFEEVGWMVSSELGGGPFGAAARMRAAALASDSLDRSQVAIGDQRVAGAILWRIDGAEAVVDARVVAARWRGGPTNLMLLQAGLLRGLAEGLVHVNFHCDETVKDTVSLARRAGAALTATKATYYYPFEGD
jgi:GNAT superfamily N-acetyltransferase